MKGQLDYATLNNLAWQIPLVVVVVGALCRTAWTRLWP
jgi:hypothetical protein